MQIEQRGRAYGFIDCNANTGDLNHYIGVAQSRMAVDQKIEHMQIRVKEGVDPEDYRHDSDLHQIAIEARNCGRITHTLEAISTDGNNFDVGSALQRTINESARAYSHVHGHGRGEGLYGKMVRHPLVSYMGKTANTGT